MRSLLPWCVIGDFNDIVDVGEKKGGSRHPRFLMDGFQKAIDDCDFVNLGFVGEAYTWEKLDEL